MKLIKNLVLTMLFLAFSSHVFAWTENTIGNWQGMSQGKSFELSIWLANDPYNGERVKVRGYFQLKNGSCKMLVTGNRAVWLNYGDYDLKTEVKHTGMAVSLSYINNNDYEKCKKYQWSSIGILHFDGTDNNSLTNWVLDHKTKKVTRQMLKRIPASAEMLSIIAKDPGSKHQWHGLNNKPTALELKLIRDASLSTKDFLSKIPLPCGEYGDKAGSVMNMFEDGPIFKIKAHSKSNDTVEVIYVKREQKLERKVFPKIKEVDWDYVSMSHKEKDGKSACRKGKATLSFFKALDEGKLSSNNDLQYDNLKLLNKIKGFYLVDMSGVDKISYGGDSMERGVVKRVFGTTTIYKPGDLTRRIIWDSAGQNINIRNTAKNSKTGSIEDDIFSKTKELSFTYLAEMSDTSKSDIWYASVNSKNEPKVCVKWKGKHNIATCIEHSNPNPNKKYQYYLTDNLNTAKKIFLKLSLNTDISIASNSNGQCTTGAFCELAGGDYLNAIYKGDIKKVRLLDQKYLKGINDITESMSNDNDIVKGIFNLMTNNNNPSLLPLLAREYLHDYKNQPKRCFNQGAKKITFNTKTPDIVGFNYYGAEISRTPGIAMYGEYFVNSELVNMCTKVCGARGWGSLLMSNQVIISSIPNMRKNYDCNSKEIKQFEKNLRKMQAQKNSGYRNFYQRNSSH